MRALDWSNDGVGVLAVEPANSSLRAHNVSPLQYTTRLTGLPNWVAELRDFPAKRSGDDGYESETSILFHMKHKSNESECEGVFVVGSKAQQLREGRSLIDTYKYDDQCYLSALVTSALLDNYPTGHNNVVIGITHPFSYNQQYCQKILNSVVGRYDITLRDGTRLKYVVRNAVPLQETLGTVSYLETRLFQLLSGLEYVENVTILDWGHGTSHELMVRIDNGNFVPDYDSARVYGIGGYTYVDILAKHLAINYKSELNIIADRVPHDSRLYRAMHTGVYRAHGTHEINVSDVVKDIKLTAGRELRDVRASRAYGNNTDAVLWVGGSSDFFAYDASAMAFPKGFTWDLNSKLIASGDELRYANLKGIRNIMLAMANRGDFTPNAKKTR